MKYVHNITLDMKSESRLEKYTYTCGYMTGEWNIDAGMIFNAHMRSEC
jgi:hypothetical protein